MLTVIRTDASPSLGLGHLMRCLALAQALISANNKVVFVLRSTSLVYCRSRRDWVGDVEVVPDSISQIKELDWMRQQVWFMSSDIVVLDGYQFDEPYREALKYLNRKVVLFDDGNTSGLLYADLIINGASQVPINYYINSAPTATLCIGDRYRLLRQEFCSADITPWAQRHFLTVMMGGSDPLNLTLPLLQSLEVRQVDLDIQVISGAAYPYLQTLQKFVQQSGLRIRLLHDCQQVAAIFNQTRLAVSAAGGSQFELLACATPSLLLMVAENQRLATQQAATQGWCEVEDVTSGVEFTVIADSIISLWNDEASLHNMHKNASLRVDVAGSSRIVEKMASLLTKI